MLELKDVSLVWQGAALIQNASFAVGPGQTIVLSGPNGTGKSSLLAAIAGLTPVDRGHVLWGGIDVTHVPLHDREGIALVPEGRLLAPSLSVMETLQLGAGRVGRRARDARTQANFARFPILADRHHQAAGTLSGGEAQILSLARALMSEPRLLLLDEPFGALDALTRGTIQDELLKIWRGTEQTVFMITHDIDEAILLADRILLMTNGPQARVAESVEITIPRPRNRTEIVEHPNYYAIRNHLVQFLGKRSKELAGQPTQPGQSNTPETVRIDVTETSDDPEDTRPALTSGIHANGSA